MVGFLRGVVRARRSILVTGMPASGKTTLLRALAREVPASRAGGDAGNRVRARPAPPGRRPARVAGDGVPPGLDRGRPGHRTRAGEITLSDLLHQTLRMSVTRVIVGEVRGAEALPMLEAMNAGMPGSMCTLHAGSAADAMERLVTAAMKGAAAGWSDTFVTRLATQGIDYVVHLRHVPHHRWGPVRFIAEIAEVTDVTETGKVAMNRIFAPAAAHGRPGWTRGPVRHGAPAAVAVRRGGGRSRLPVVTRRRQPGPTRDGCHDAVRLGRARSWSSSGAPRWRSGCWWRCWVPGAGRRWGRRRGGGAPCGTCGRRPGPGPDRHGRRSDRGGG